MDTIAAMVLAVIMVLCIYYGGVLLLAGIIWFFGQVGILGFIISLALFVWSYRFIKKKLNREEGDRE